MSLLLELVLQTFLEIIYDVLPKWARVGCLLIAALMFIGLLAFIFLG